MIEDTPLRLGIPTPPARPGELADFSYLEVPAAGSVGRPDIDTDPPAMRDLAYTMIKVGKGTGGGIMKQLMPGAPSAWLAYVDVDDIAAATKKAQSLGATIMKDVTEVMGYGWLSIITDPTGAMLGLWKSKT